MPVLQEIHIARIDRCHDSRAIDPNWVAAIREARERGAEPSPIDVIALPNGRFRQIFGQHRLEAEMSLDREVITARVFAEDEFASEAAIKRHQIEENLISRPLSALDKALALFEWKTAYEAENPVHSHGGRRVKLSEDEQVDKLSTCFSDMAAAALGVNEKSIRRSIFIARGLSRETVRLLSLTPTAENQQQLLELAGMEREAQEIAAEAIHDGKSFDEAMALASGDGPAPSRPVQRWEKIAHSIDRLGVRERHAIYEHRRAEILEWLEATGGEGA